MNEFKTINKQARLLLALMTGLKEFQWFEKDNDMLILDDTDIKLWASTTRLLEELVSSTDDRLPQVERSTDDGQTRCDNKDD